VTSFDPLKVYLFREGLVRFATEKYSNERDDLKNVFAHLTNFSLNKDSENYVYNEACDEDGVGSKWSMRALFMKFKHLGLTFPMEQIRDAIIKTLISAEGPFNQLMKKSGKDSGCFFELFGFDIILDSDLKPWILEVNTSPSLSSSSPLDKKLKTTLMCDVFNLIGVQPRNCKKRMIN
jgi:tubulin polyglutamylase TTLL4